MIWGLKSSDILTDFKLTYKRFGDRSVLIEWPQEIDKKTLQNVLRFKEVLKNHYIKREVYINNAYNSLLINYDCSIENIYNEISILKTLYLEQKIEFKIKPKRWKIPVCYNALFGLDLEEISVKNNLKKEAVIKLHSNPIYTIYFIGFLPGFLYLGGLDKKLHIPRRSNPRLKVEKGSVAIGGYQTGVYPSESPGGWNIIGNSPINFFDNSKQRPCFAKAGDEIQFVPVTIEEHIDIMILVESGVYQIESEVIDG